MSYSSSIFNILLSKIEDFSIEAFSSGSTVLGEIAHSLSGKCSLKKGIERLSRHLAEEFPKGWEKNYRHLVSRIMPQKRLIFCVDDSGIAKIYGKKFQDLGTVRDASSPDKKLVKGYHVTSIVGLSEIGRQPLPVFDRVHSSVSDGYTSANDITFAGIKYCCAGLADYTSTFTSTEDTTA